MKQLQTKRKIRPSNVNELNKIKKLLQKAPLESLTSFLDVGLGKGDISKWLAKKGKKVTAIGLELNSYGVELAEMKENYNIDVFECSVEKMPFEDQTFNAVIMVHVLEHCYNIGIALNEVRRVLMDSGMLLIIVPPCTGIVTAGHITDGWNLGQLIYILLLNGFNVREGKFIESGNNVCAFVKKNNRPLPALRHDQWDIQTLNNSNLFPVPVVTMDGKNDSYWAKIKCINWDNPEEFLFEFDNASRLRRYLNRYQKIFHPLIKIIPLKLRRYIGNFLVGLGDLLNPPDKNSNYKINPKVLVR